MDSKQWTRNLPAEVRDVLDAGASMSAPSGAKQAVWSALSAKLPLATAGAAAGGLSVLSIAKPLAVGLAIGAAVTVGAIEIRSKVAPAPPASLSHGATRVNPTPAGSPPSELAPNAAAEQAPQSAAAPAIKAAPTPSSVQGAPPTSALSAGALGDRPPISGTSSVAAFPDEAAPQEHRTVLESRRLNQARAALQAGDARGAVAQLDAIAVDFPSGVLVQERDALRIEALLGLGEHERARELARQFLARHPHSPHAAAVQRALH
jgi:hypothetical protein